ncbi:MAG: Octopine catabolism/uptake operon regulatory protein OccR [Paracidovorax wautersii]|uniref:Octopine catabolism/uptake operon regulatory protein OccR n=1 Tax=Paracidovorax wautersii TaxID=1177982 RepID=A0A7V8JS49_9BURK|nr:MAG: Octopine catabolism/uptake operon regulatory protein OccR [Paracidovorax wautersii]
MELRQLEAFAATLSSGSVSGAARLLGRSQPAVSRLIQELEAEIGYALFQRAGPRVTPTEQGFLLFEDVERALLGLRQIRERADDIARGRSRPLRLAATNALAVGLLPAALQRIAPQIEATPLSIRSAPAEQVVHAVLTGSAHWGLSSLPLDHKGLQVHWVARASCVVALPEGDPLAAHGTVPLAALATRRVITMANPYRLRHRLDRAWARAGLSTRPDLRPPQIETNSSMNAQALVRAGLGVAVLEPATVLGAPLPGVVVRALDVGIPFFPGVVTPQSQPLHPALQALSDALLETARELLPGWQQYPAHEHAELLRQLGEPDVD